MIDKDDMLHELHARMTADTFLVLFRGTSMLHHEPLHAHAHQLMQEGFEGTQIAAHVITIRRQLM